MNQTWTRWAVFGACLITILAAMGWMTSHLLRMEVEQVESVREAELQERIRLALWRLDSVVNTLLVRENARPVEHFRAFREADQLFDKSNRRLSQGEVLVPSPLLTDRPEYVRLYFEVEEEQEARSPQSPTGEELALALANFNAPEEVDQASAQLACVAPLSNELLATATAICREPSTTDFSRPSLPAVDTSWGVAQQDQKVAQSLKSQVELNSRSNLLAQNYYSVNSPALPKRKEAALKEAGAAEQLREETERNGGEWEAISATPYAACWKDLPGMGKEKSPAQELFLLRKISSNGNDWTQAVWLDWSGLRTVLLGEVEDLLPQAALIPLERESSGEAANSLGRPLAAQDPERLASIPVKLIHGSGAVPVGIPALGTGLRRSLLVAWICLAAAGVAVGGLLYGAWSLSERRGAFVSAVTHELRTPLTTFQLYSDLLAEGISQDDPEKQREYVETLRGESERLGHLVENVLAYARLERGSARRQTTTLSLGELVAQFAERLERRACQSGMELATEVPDEAGRKQVKVDLGAVEQILYNLVDNACKYGQSEDGKGTIHLEADVSGEVALLRVRDHGPGIASSEARRLFRPFEKSAQEAAHSAPGVGLGLALCRKMSHVLGARLRLEESEEQEVGACFVLELPVA